MPKLMSPKYARKNYMAGTYSEIAMEALYKADGLYKKIQEENYSANSFEHMDEFEKQIVIAVVFSAMCIESFFNDYAATELGDDEFYDNFDKLSTISKFQLIAKFILKTKIDKSESYYGFLKVLIKNRDSYVHNKSKGVQMYMYSEEEAKEFFDAFIENASEYVDEPHFKSEIDSCFQQAVDAMKAVRDIAIFFTEKTKRYDSLSFLLRPTTLLMRDSQRIDIVKRVYELLDLKLTTSYEFKYNSKTIMQLDV